MSNDNLCTGVSVGCDNCGRMLCRDLRPHFPSGLNYQDWNEISTRFIQGMEFATHAAAYNHAQAHGWWFIVNFPTTQTAHDVAVENGWLSEGQKLFCPDCSTPEARAWLNRKTKNGQIVEYNLNHYRPDASAGSQPASLEAKQ